MSEIFEPMSEAEPRSGDAHRGAVLDALRGAATRGWLGPAAEAAVDSSAETTSDGLLKLDLLTLSVQAAVERVAVPLARTARALVQARIWSQFGYARIEDYARERFDRTGRWLHDQASLGRTLQRFGALSAALGGEDGGRPLGKQRALLVGRVASEESVGAWIEVARSVTVRELRELVRTALRRGSDRPLIESEPSSNEKGFGGDDRCLNAGSLRSEISSDKGCTVSTAASLSNDTHALEHEISADCGAEAGVDLDERCRLRLAAPVAVRTAFDEAVWLQRAVSGREGSVTSFVEALVAEAHAGPRPPDAGEDVETDFFVRRHGADAVLERELAKKTRSWARLSADGSESRSASALAADALARLEAIARRAGQGDAAELDRQLRGLIDLEDELERRLGRLLRELHDRGAWRRLSFAGMGHYAEQRLGLGRTTAEDRARLARVVKRYPQLAQAYEQGRVGMESARIVVRILNESGSDPAVERAWVERAERATVKRMRDELRALGRQQAFEDRPGPVVPLDDAAWHGSLMQRPGEIRSRVHDLAARAVATGCPDVFLRLTLPADLAQGFLAAVESARRVLADQASMPGAASGECEALQRMTPEEGATGTLAGAFPASMLAARMFSAAGKTVPSWVGLLALLEDFVDTWDVPEGMPRRRADAIYAREGWRCFAPGCTSRCNLEDHHLEYKSQGGNAKAMWNQLCLCGFHHRPGEHEGLASCRGKAPLDVLWRLGRADLGEWFRNEITVGQA